MPLLRVWESSKVRKMNSCPFQCRNSIVPVVIQGDLAYFPLLHVFVLFLFIWELLDLLVSLLTTYRFPWAEASSWAGLHPPAICEIQDPGPVTVWNRNQKALELLCAQYYTDFRRVSPLSTQRNLSQNLDMGSFSYYLEISLYYP